MGQAAGPDSLTVLRCPEQAECPRQRARAARRAPAYGLCSSGRAHTQPLGCQHPKATAAADVSHPCQSGLSLPTAAHHPSAPSSPLAPICSTA